MSQQKTWAANRGTTTRVATDGSPKQGSGDNKRIYVGRQGSYNYDGYLDFAVDWTNVGRIVSAVLQLYTDDGLGSEGVVMAASDTPKVTIRRLTSAFSEHTGSETFTTDDYTTPTYTTSGQRAGITCAKDSLGLTSIDITAIVNTWAPKTVKKSDGTAGAGTVTQALARVLGIALNGLTSTENNVAFISEDAEPALAAYKPVIVLTYELGPTIPSVTGVLSPSGAVDAIGSFQGDFTDARATDRLAFSEVQVYDAGAAATTNAGTDSVIRSGHGLIVGDKIYFTAVGTSGLTAFQLYYVRVVTNSSTFRVSTTATGSSFDITGSDSVTYSKLVSAPGKRAASETEIVNGRFDQVPEFHPAVNTNYRWRARVYDNEGQVSAFTSLTTFSVNNTDPNPPTLSPVDASTYASLDGVQFTGGTFSDPDAGDTLLAYQVQLSAYPEGDAHWLDDEFILWNTGKRYVASGSTDWTTPYGGASLSAGTYYWRARQWDNHQGVSDFEYASIILTDDFEVEANDANTHIQMRPRARWRIVIRGMGALRGPGSVVAILEDAKNVGATLLYNSPGEAHWTLPASHPQIAVIEPKQTHYAIEFRQGDGWREVFAGLVYDVDATATDIIFYGLDYLALLDYNVDTKLILSNLEAAYNKGGSKYPNVAIRTIIIDQLARARAKSNALTGFITTGSISSALSTTTTVYSTYQPTLNFLTGLIESYKAGRGKRTRLFCRKTTSGYEWVVSDDPGIARDNLRLRYGELVQGYRVIPFGKDWGTRVAAFGRNKDGIKVNYSTQLVTGVSEATYGRWERPAFFDGVSNPDDLNRRTKQAAQRAGVLGSQVAIGIRSGFLQPRDGYDLCDLFPIDIDDGAIDTAAFGHDGYWAAMGITWTASEQGEQTTTLTLQPKETGSSPSANLLQNQPISGQAEWQIGWQDPNPLAATSKFWLDQTTGKVYSRGDGDLIAEGATGDV